MITITTKSPHLATELQVIKLSGFNLGSLNKEFKIKEIVSASTFKVTSTGIPDGSYSLGAVSFPPANWISKTFGTKKAYSSNDPSSTKLWAEIDDSTPNYSLLTGYEVYDEHNGGLNASSCLSPYFFKRGNVLGNSKWVVVANDKTCYIGIETLPRSVTGWDATPGYCFGGFGDFTSFKENDAFSFFVRGTLGSPNSNFPNYDDTFAATISSACYKENGSSIPIRVARSYNEITKNIDCNTFALPFPLRNGNMNLSGSSDSSIPFPDYLGNIIYSDLYISEPITKKPRGKLPGIKFCLNAVGDQLHSTGTDLSFINKIDGDDLTSYLGLKWLNGVQFFDVSNSDILFSYSASD